MVTINDDNDDNSLTKYNGWHEIFSHLTLKY